MINQINNNNHNNNMNMNKKKTSKSAYKKLIETWFKQRKQRSLHWSTPIYPKCNQTNK